MKSPSKIVLSDGLVYVAVVIVGGVILDPVISSSNFEVERVVANMMTAFETKSGKVPDDFIVKRYKMKVIPGV